jgi:hypothetical protein
MNIKVTIEPVNALTAKQSDGEVLSHILSALYGRMGDFGWRSVRVELIPETKS